MRGHAMSESHIAVIAQDDLKLEAFLAGLTASVLASAKLSLLGSSDDLGNSVIVNGRPEAFAALDDADLSDVDLVVVLQSPLFVDAYQTLLSGLTCPVLGFLADINALNPQVGSAVVSHKTAVLGIYQPLVLALQQILGELDCESIHLVPMFPAAIYGQQGIQELAAQTACLLNAQSLKHSVFDQQIPFNYFPMAANGFGQTMEKQLQSEMALIWADADVSLTAIQMPVFHGVAAVASVVLSQATPIQQFMAACQSQPALQVCDMAQDLSNLAIVQQENKITIGQIKQAENDPHRLDFWFGLDDTKFGIGENLVFVAESLLKHDL